MSTPTSASYKVPVRMLLANASKPLLLLLGLGWAAISSLAMASAEIYEYQARAGLKHENRQSTRHQDSELDTGASDQSHRIGYPRLAAFGRQARYGRTVKISG